MAKEIPKQKIENCDKCPFATVDEVPICTKLIHKGIPYNGIREDCPLNDVPQKEVGVYEVEQFYKAVNQDCASCLKAHDAEIRKKLEKLIYIDDYCNEYIYTGGEDYKKFWKQREGK
jgi:hypothetical protein